jgi:hypothetical protein
VYRIAGPGAGAQLDESSDYGFIMMTPVPNNCAYLGVNVPSLRLGLSRIENLGAFESLDFQYSNVPAAVDPGLSTVVQDATEGNYHITKASLKSTKIGSIYHYIATPSTVTPAFNPTYVANKAAIIFAGGPTKTTNSLTNSGLSFVGTGGTLSGYNCYYPGEFCVDSTIGPDNNFNFEFNTTNN